jgi:hypothetical protein
MIEPGYRGMNAPVEVMTAVTKRVTHTPVTNDQTNPDASRAGAIDRGARQ